MPPLCFFDTNILAAISVRAKFKLNQKEETIEHKLYNEVKDIQEKAEKLIGLALTSQTVIAEIYQTIDRIIYETLETFKKEHPDTYLSIAKKVEVVRILHELNLQSKENLERILAFIDKPPVNIEKRDKLKKEVLEFLLSLYREYLKVRKFKRRMPVEPPDESDAKILSDAILIFQDIKSKQKDVKFYFVTMDSFFTEPPVTGELYKKYGFNGSWPSEVLKLL
jgi:hypothetical protein